LTTYAQSVKGQGQGNGASDVAKLALFYVSILRRFDVELKTDN